MTLAETIVLEWTKAFSNAFDGMENSQCSFFVTGKAGTGKSTLLQYFREHTKKNIVVLAPTGVAALNIHGQTLHSFFHFRPDITPESIGTLRLTRRQKALYKKIDSILIDEISMVRADLLDCVDRFLQMYGKYPGKPFGGIQMIFIGDLYQLPPVVPSDQWPIFHSFYASPYFFDARVFSSTNFRFKIIELDKIFRQKDDVFIELLNAIRNNTLRSEHFALLQSRVSPNFRPQDEDFYIYLTTTNAMANSLNSQRLNALPGQVYRVQGKIHGEFERNSCPTKPMLEIKVGAQVMLLNNHPKGIWVNGSIGIVRKIYQRQGELDGIDVELADGSSAWVEPYTWEMFRTVFNAEEKRLDSELVGSFTQYPLRLSWALTIHKSQGKTFSRVIIDIGDGAFSHGQTYVALSRCTSLDGLILMRPILKKHIIMDQRISWFMSQVRQNEKEHLAVP